MRVEGLIMSNKEIIEKELESYIGRERKNH